MSPKNQIKNELLIDAGFEDRLSFKSIQMRTTFIAFAILLILGMISVKVV